MTLLDDARHAGSVRVKCNWACGVCSVVCKAGCITYGEGCVEIDLDRCVLCLFCVRVCPVGLIGENDLV